MKVLFLISSDDGNGVGGHFHSLNQVSIEMASGHDVKIIILGNTAGQVITNNPYFDRQIKVTGGIGNLIKVNSEFKSFIKSFRPDIIHCFDNVSLNKILLIPALSSIPVILNKCGGKNPVRGNYQHADAIVVFSKENQNWFLQNNNYDSNDIFLIPNRVRKLQFFDENQRIEQKDPKKITFVRISRLGGAYEKTLLDTYNLIEELGKKYPVELIVVGRIQNQQRFDMLLKEATDRKLPVKFITDERAAKGSGFLYLADFVIGTGRSFMEALSFGIPTLTPAENANYPMLVTPVNFQHFFETNFSERNIADPDTLDNNLSNIEKLILDKSKYESEKKGYIDLFNEFFGTDSILPKYNAVYNYTVNKKTSRLRLIRKNFVYLVKFLMGK